jgi:hypothetical protein
LSVCFGERDHPANKSEIESIAKAIEKSKKFIIILTKELMEDECHKHEVNAIMEVVWERRSRMQKDVLVVKLDDCQVPNHWRGFELHDWSTGNLSREDHLLRLMRWVNCQRSHELGALDKLISAMPLLSIAILLITPIVLGRSVNVSG